MSSGVNRMVGGVQAPPTPSPVLSAILRLILLAAFDVFMLWLAFNIANDGNRFFAIAIVLTTIVVTAINLIPQLFPLRWMSVALGLLILLAIYPLIYTAYVSFTNFSDGHRYTKVEAIELLEQREYLPDGAVNYYWSPLQNEAGEIALWLRSSEDETQVFLARQGEPLLPVTPFESGTAPYSEGIRQYPDGVPTEIEGFMRLEGAAYFGVISAIEDQRNAGTPLVFATEDEPIGISGRSEAGNYQPLWVYDEADDVLINKQTNVAYEPNGETGDFVAPDGSKAPIGYWVHVGLANFEKAFTSSLLDGPLLQIFFWTVTFAFFSVVTSFAMGLMIALVLNSGIPGARIIRSILLIPWAIPGMIGILIWRGMLNGNVGIIPTMLDDLVGSHPAFLTDPMWAKFSILLVNLWFAYPYFMLISSGSLQGIPAAIYEAAEVDGATSWHKFWGLTLPLLLISMGPLLIASFIFNFNNFVLIEALTEGRPLIPGTNAPPVGYTDNLITYTYRHAFATGGQKDFGYAAALAMVIFAIVGTLTLVQFRMTRRWEEIGENV